MESYRTFETPDISSFIHAFKESAASGAVNLTGRSNFKASLPEAIFQVMRLTINRADYDFRGNTNVRTNERTGRIVVVQELFRMIRTKVFGHG